MKKKLTAILVCAAAALVLSACSSSQAPSEPPDLTGHWAQNSDGEWYFIGTVTEDKIQIWWYLPAENKTQLYWSGSFTPPSDGKEPYTWESVNDYTEAYLDSLFKYRRTSREPTKEFTYKDGKISYTVTSGNLALGYAIEKTDDPSVPVGRET